MVEKGRRLSGGEGGAFFLLNSNPTCVAQAYGFWLIFKDLVWYFENQITP